MKELINDIQEHYCSFEVSTLLKEKGFKVMCEMFYTKPRSKMFGIDEHGRYYPIINKSKCLYISGQASALIKNIIYAPTHSMAIEWIRVNFGICIPRYTSRR
jgi:hypothetical protein